MTHQYGSPYIEWSKLDSSARYNLTASGVLPVSASELGATLEDLEIAGTSQYGYEPVLEGIAAHCGVPRECIVLAAGTSMANHLAMAALVAPGDEVVIERPTYEPLLSTAQYFGASIRRVERRPRDAFALDPEEVCAAITPGTRLVVLANLHNPSSQLTPVDSLREVGNAAERVGARVLVDEVYLDAVFDDPPRPAFHLGPTFVTTNSLTKVYGLSGLRCGWILCDRDLAYRIWRLKDLFDNVPAVPAERLSVLALDRLPRLLSRARALLTANRALFTRFLDAHGSRIDVVTPPFGTTVCVRPRQIDADRLCTVLRNRYETTVVPGRFFELPDHVRIGLCGETAALTEGLDRLGQALHQLTADGHA